MQVVKSSDAEVLAVCCSSRTKDPATGGAALTLIPAFITQIGVAVIVPVKTAWIASVSPTVYVKEWDASAQVVEGFVIVQVTACGEVFLYHVKTTTLFVAIVRPSAALMFAPKPE